MNDKTKLMLAAIVVLAAYAVGRYLQPAEVITKTDTKIVQVEVEKEKIHYKTITKYLKSPDGTESREEIVEQISEREDTSIKSEIKKEETHIINVKPQWKLQASVEIKNLSGSEYRIGIEKRIIGPVFAGPWAETNLHSYGVSLSMEF